MLSYKKIVLALATFTATVNALLPTRVLSPSDGVLTIDGLLVDGVLQIPSQAERRNSPAVPLNEPYISNAQRLARGLPLNPPNLKRSRYTGARRDTPSSQPPITKTGPIRVQDATSGNVLGYISENTNNNNHFGISTRDQAISFTFNVNPTIQVTTDVDIAATTTTYTNQWPFMGGIVGVVNTSDDIGLDSSNFAYIQGTTHTAPDSPPISVSNSYPSAEDSESAIWTYDSSSQRIQAQWVNTDSTLPQTFLVYVQGSNALVLTGDVTSFENAFTTSSQVYFYLDDTPYAP